MARAHDHEHSKTDRRCHARRDPFPDLPGPRDRVGAAAAALRSRRRGLARALPARSLLGRAGGHARRSDRHRPHRGNRMDDRLLLRARPRLRVAGARPGRDREPGHSPVHRDHGRPERARLRRAVDLRLPAPAARHPRGLRAGKPGGFPVRRAWDQPGRHHGRADGRARRPPGPVQALGRHGHVGRRLPGARARRRICGGPGLGLPADPDHRGGRPRPPWRARDEPHDGPGRRAAPHHRRRDLPRDCLRYLGARDRFGILGAAGRWRGHALARRARVRAGSSSIRADRAAAGSGRPGRGSPGRLRAGRCCRRLRAGAGGTGRRFPG